MKDFGGSRGEFSDWTLQGLRDEVAKILIMLLLIELGAMPEDDQLQDELAQSLIVLEMEISIRLKSD